MMLLLPCCICEEGEGMVLELMHGLNEIIYGRHAQGSKSPGNNDKNS